MKRVLSVWALMTLLGITALNAQVKFEDYFLEKTMRFDFYHAGDAKNELYFFDEVIEEPYWAGSKNYLVDNRGMGNQVFKVVDKASGKVIYQRGYSTLFSEWMSTPEAKITPKAMPEGVTFPYPKNDVIVEIYTRENPTGKLHKKFSYEIDVDSYFIRKSRPSLSTFDVHYTGNPAQRVDIVLISEGYTEAEKEAYVKACQQFAEDLLSYHPYTENKNKFNIRAVWAPSQESGVSIPGEHLWRNTALNAHYYTFDSERYQMIEDYQSILDKAANVPYEIIYILTNSQKYGGGGIYNFYGISAANIPGPSTRKTYSHEFGHLFVGLADEYVGGTEMSDLYFKNVEPWEPNITTLADFDSKEWKSMMGNAPIPTPVKESNWELNPQNPASANYNPEKPWKLGVYEGGGYLEKGVYRPWPNCMMNWFHRIDVYCPVCVREIQKTIDLYTK
ncbi:MAG: peptidase M64 [Mediterranea massiliensis]|nr:peptidase M64 [Mediterranea massiliensis]